MSPGRSKTVDRVLRGELCTGCGLCAAVSDGAITMSSQTGFSRPVQHGAVPAAAERVIAEACPGSVVAAWGQAPNTHPYWGPWWRVATGHSTDEAIRFQASSGGALTGLAVYALTSGLVDRVVHVKADPDDPTGNVVTVSSSPAEILAGAGSRYAASSPLAGLEAVLSDKGAFAFIGKPCDVSALRRLARLDPRIDRHVPLTLAFFCAGIPNQRGVRNVLKAMEIAPDELTSFRYRGHGWPGAAVAVAADGRVARMSYARSWGEHLSPELQFRCKICPDAVGGSADIAFADAWECDERGYPIMEERDGRSLIVTRTEVGDRFLTEALAAGAVEMTPLAAEEIDSMQPHQARRKRAARARMAALAVTLRPAPDATGTFVEAAARRGSVQGQLRDFLGTIRRVLIRRL